MVIKLKSYRLKLKKKPRMKARRRSGTGDIITGATGALIGTAFVAQTAGVLRGL